MKMGWKIWFLWLYLTINELHAALQKMRGERVFLPAGLGGTNIEPVCGELFVLDCVLNIKLVERHFKSPTTDYRTIEISDASPTGRFFFFPRP